MEQNSEDWLKWRTSGIGASDSPILLGLSKRTPYQLWLEKKGRVKSHTIPVFAKAKGGETEAMLRAKYSLETGLNFQPACASSDKYPWMLASYDGVALETTNDGDTLRAIEIKFVGKDIYEWGEVKEAHKVQVQHQILVMDLEYVDYLMSMDGSQYKAIRIFPDPQMQAKILEACNLFYAYLQGDTPPPLTEDDWWPATPQIEAILNGPMDEDARNRLKGLMEHPKYIGTTQKAQRDKRGALRITKINIDQDLYSE